MNEEEIKKLIKSQKEDIFDRVDVSINKRLQHFKSSPETVSEINNLKLKNIEQEGRCKNAASEISSIKEDVRDLKNKRPPAPATLEFMEEQRDFNETIRLSMNDLKHDVQDLVKSLDVSNKINETQHCEIIKRLGRMEKFGISVLIIFALATLYFIFESIGLPH
jgi:hypothetical protein